MDVYAAREDPVPGVTGALVAAAVPLPPDQVVFEPSWSAVADEAVAPAAARRHRADRRRRRRDDDRPRGAGPAGSAPAAGGAR